MRGGRLIKALLLILFIVLNIILISFLVRALERVESQAEPVKLQVHKRFFLSPGSALDIDGDGEKEILASHAYPQHKGKMEWSIFKPAPNKYQFNFLGQFLVPLHSQVLTAKREITPEGERIVFSFLVRREGELYLEDYTNQGIRLSSRKLEKIHYPGPVRGGFTCFLEDLEKDGRKELVIIVGAGYEKYPRGVIVYDYSSGKLLWDFYSGPPFVSHQITDLDGDGRQEIVLGSFACNNGAEAGGMKDSESWVLVLNSRGEKLWGLRLGNYYTSLAVHAHDLNGDGRKEVIVTKEVHSGMPEPGQVWIMDGLTGAILATFIRADTSFSIPYVNTFPEGPRIFVGDSQGNIWKFDENLNCLASLNVGEPVAVINPSDAPPWHYIYAMTPSRILVLNTELDRIIFEKKLSNPVAGTWLANFKRMFDFSSPRSRIRFGVIVGDYYYYVWETPPSFRLLAAGFFKTWALPIILCLFLFNYIAYRVAKGEILVTSLSVKDVQQRYERWVEVMRELMHRLRSGFTTVRWNIELIERNLKKYHPELRQISNKLELLRNDLQNLDETFTRINQLFEVDKPRLTKINLATLFKPLLMKYSQILSGKIKVETNLQDVVIPADPHLLKEAVNNLIQNAIDAMPDGGILTIRCYPVNHPLSGRLKGAMIEVEDTGTGIPGDKIKKIFDLRYTTKRKGMGIGLTIVKRVVEAHGGNLKVYSQPGLGTKFAIFLPYREVQTNERKKEGPGN